MRKLVGRACGLTGSGKRPRRRSARSESTTTHMARTRAHPVRTSPPPAARRVNRVKSARAYSSDESARRPPGVARHHGFFTPPAKRRNEPRTLRVGLCRGFYLIFHKEGLGRCASAEPGRALFRTPTSPAQSPHSIYASRRPCCSRPSCTQLTISCGIRNATPDICPGGRRTDRAWPVSLAVELPHHCPCGQAWQSNCLTIASVGKPPTPIHCAHIGARGCRIGTTGGPPHPGVKFTPGPQAPPHIRRLIPHPIIHVPN